VPGDVRVLVSEMRCQQSDACSMMTRSQVKGNGDLYVPQVVSATKTYNWDGKNKLEQQWTFAGAMLYSITVITTIGL